MQAGHWIIMGLIVLTTLVAGHFVQKRFFHGGPNTAQRRWEWIGVPISLVWVASLIYVGKTIEKGDVDPRLPLEIGIAVAALFGVASVWWMYHWLRKADEMIRRVEIEAMALCLGLGMVASIAFNQLGQAEIGPFGDFGAGTAQLMPFFMAYGISRVIVYLRYR